MTAVPLRYRRPGLLLVVIIVGLGAYSPEARAQTDSPDRNQTPPAGTRTAGAPESEAAAAASTTESPEPRRNLSILERIRLTFTQDEDSDGQIDTDRPTFTPAHTAVPLGRLQFESGFTFNYEPTNRTHNELYDFPELAMRYGFMERAEFRMLWQGTTHDDVQSPSRRPSRLPGGAGDTEVGFKWQFLTKSTERRWVPGTSLITSIIAPTGGGSRLSNQTVEPYINLVYGWGLTDKFTFCGSTGYLGVRQQPPPDTIGQTVNFQRFSQSLVGFYSVNDRTTLFYEWYAFMFTNAPSNLPTHYMDGGILYHPTPNTQIDLRAGFGLSGRPDDFFTGAGFSIRF
jgi:hypothetical protein